MSKCTNDKLAKKIRQRIQLNLLMYWPDVLRQYLRTAAELKKVKEED